MFRRKTKKLLYCDKKTWSKDRIKERNIIDRCHLTLPYRDVSSKYIYNTVTYNDIWQFSHQLGSQFHHYRGHHHHGAQFSFIQFRTIQLVFLLNRTSPLLIDRFFGFRIKFNRSGREESVLLEAGFLLNRTSPLLTDWFFGFEIQSFRPRRKRPSPLLIGRFFGFEIQSIRPRRSVLLEASFLFNRTSPLLIDRFFG